jgi:glycosyltransferase involved in cell wall biosynthesis
VEEPWATVVARPTLRTEEHGAVTRVWFEFYGESEWHVPFDDDRATGYGAALAELLGPPARRTVWLYAPTALQLARALEPSLVVYDMMDDLAAFARASPAMKAQQREALETADVVFTGGRSLHNAALAVRPDAHLFPSGVDVEHFAAASGAARERGNPVAGYVGVIDERLDVRLVRELAAALPHWQIRMVGPISEKLGRANAPTAPNILYTGQQPYERLPEILGEFDVALMPFALNEATRSISPTKTLEYLAAGLPVVSTRVPDVVADYARIVEFADDGESFAAACRRALGRDRGDWQARVGPLLRRHEWDAIAARMDAIVEEAGGRGRGW